MLLIVKKQLLSFLILMMFSLSCVAQTKEAVKVDEFNLITPCDSLLASGDAAFQILTNDPELSLYIIYYEGKKKTIIHNEKTKQEEIRLVNPRRGEALNRTKALTFYLLERRKTPQSRLVTVNGGYRENQEVEVWVVPKGTALPKATPTVAEKDMKFRKGKPASVRDCYQEVMNYK